MLPNLPDRLQAGLFRTARTYPCLLRFSSSSPQMKPDTTRDVHGMAIKLVGVEGRKLLEDEQDALTQDFVLANNDVFFVRSSADYVEFAAAYTAGRVLSFFFGWNPFRWRLHEFFNMLRATRKLLTNPLQIRYWSQTPAALGELAVKYSAIPCAGTVDPMPSSPGPDFLRDALLRTSQKQEVLYDFLVQVQTDAVRMPVEDTTIPWLETESPFVKVATIRIPAQSEGPTWDVFAENLSFTPWHSLPEHRPLGAMNRVRRRVYETISRLRHEKNGVARKEPDPGTLAEQIESSY